MMRLLTGLARSPPGSVRWGPSPALRLQLTGDVVSRDSSQEMFPHSLNEASEPVVGKGWDYREVCSSGVAADARCDVGLM